MSRELHELCCKYQVCTPEKANKLIEMLQEKGFELPKNVFWVTITTDALLLTENSKIVEITTENDVFSDVVFNLSEVLIIAKCFGFNERDFKWNSDQFITQVKNGDYLYGVANLEYWYAEALADFLIKNAPKNRISIAT